MPVEPPFSIEEPLRLTSPVIVSSPHSGEVYPPEFLAQSRLHASVLRRSEDMHVDRLVEGASRHGGPLIRAHFPRAYVDANREPYELDPRMFEGRLPPHANTRSLRVAGGLGAIPRIVGDSLEIYGRRLQVEEALARIANHHRPYHAALSRLIGRTMRSLGVAILIDMHSMPSASVERDQGRRVDLVVGDRFGTSAAPALVEWLEARLSSMGYRALRNRPYAGGYITEHYGAPDAGQHAVQIEINRALYMNEANGALLPGFVTLKRDLMCLFADLAGMPLIDLAPQRRAAE
jgi:N-formylglutamate amidohydrolase